MDGGFPTGAYWNPTRIVSDNRLAAFATDISTYVFSAPVGTSVELPSQQITVEVTLLFRRIFKELMDQKGWEVPNIVMAQETISLP